MTNYCEKCIGTGKITGFPEDQDCPVCKGKRTDPVEITKDNFLEHWGKMVWANPIIQYYKYHLIGFDYKNELSVIHVSTKNDIFPGNGYFYEEKVYIYHPETFEPANDG